MNSKQNCKNILETDFHGVNCEHLLAMINSALYKNKKPDWNEVLEKIKTWTEKDFKQLTAKELKKFYETQLKSIVDHDQYYIVDKITQMKAKNSELLVLINWKYFPPTDPNRSTNWISVNHVPSDKIRQFLMSEENKKMFKAEMNQLPPVYAEKLEYFLGDNYLLATNQNSLQGRAATLVKAMGRSNQTKVLHQPEHQQNEQDTQLQQMQLEHQQEIQLKDRQISQLQQQFSHKDSMIKKFNGLTQQLHNQLQQTKSDRLTEQQLNELGFWQGGSRVDVSTIWDQ